MAPDEVYYHAVLVIGGMIATTRRIRVSPLQPPGVPSCDTGWYHADNWYHYEDLHYRSWDGSINRNQTTPNNDLLQSRSAEHISGWIYYVARNKLAINMTQSRKCIVIICNISEEGSAAQIITISLVNLCYFFDNIHQSQKLFVSSLNNFIKKELLQYCSHPMYVFGYRHWADYAYGTKQTPSVNIWIRRDRTLKFQSHWAHYPWRVASSPTLSVSNRIVMM